MFVLEKLVPMCVAAVLLSGGAEACLSEALPVRNAMQRIANIPDLSEFGIEEIQVLYEGEFRKPGALETEIDRKWIVENVLPKVAYNEDIVVVDIESWHPILEIEKYISVIEIFKEFRPETKFGYYGVLPYREYIGVINDRQLRTLGWKVRNSLMTPLAEVVDIVFPSLYTFSSDYEDWEKYARENIAEAKKYGKPVFPFIWPKYYYGSAERFTNGNILKEEFVSGKFWKLQLETIESSGADGVVIWRGYREIWLEDSPWWEETMNFVCE